MLSLFARPSSVDKLATSPRKVKSGEVVLPPSHPLARDTPKRSGRSQPAPAVRACVGPYLHVASLALHPHTRVGVVVRQGKGQTELGERLVLKSLRRSRDEHRLMAEVRALVRCHKHPNITTCVDVMQDKANVHLVTEYAPLGDLFSSVDHTTALNENLALALFAQLAHAVHHMHMLGVAHRDIKPENVLLRSRTHLLLCDFGSATTLGKDDGQAVVCTDQAGTLCYQPPEAVLAHVGQAVQYDPCAVDVWGCGLVLHFLLTGVPLFPHDDSALEQIVAHKSPVALPSAISSDTTQLVHSMLHPNPAQRPTISDVLDTLRKVRSPVPRRRASLAMSLSQRSV